MQLQLHASQADRVLRSFSPLIAPAAGGAVGEMHIAMEGVWMGHPEGPFALTRETFEQMIAAFEAQKTAIVIDRDHSAPAVGDTRAAGWIHGLEIREGADGAELWAKPVEWTPSATAEIKAGEYKFCSGWFQTSGAVDRKTGKVGGARLLNVALTNMPFIDGQKSIQLSYSVATAPAAPQQGMAMPEGMQAFIDQVAATAGVDANTALQAMLSLADKIGGIVRDNLDANPDGPEMTKPADPKPEAAATETALSEIEARAVKQTVEVLTNEIKALRDSVATITAGATKAAETARAERVDGMIAAGELADTEREDALFVLASAPERFDRIYGGRKGLGKKVPIGEHQAGPEKHTVTASETDARVAALSKGEKDAYGVLMQSGRYTPEKALLRLSETAAKAASRNAG